MTTVEKVLTNSHLIKISRKNKRIKFVFSGSNKTNRSSIVLHEVFYANFGPLEEVNIVATIKIISIQNLTDSFYEDYPYIAKYRNCTGNLFYLESKTGLNGMALFERGDIDVGYTRKKYLNEETALLNLEGDMKYTYSAN